MMSDIRGFTTLSEQLEPARVVTRCSIATSAP
jgi:class 3 adenylate cyclase